jgi:hypothetical protein
LQVMSAIHLNSCEIKVAAVGSSGKIQSKRAA